MFRSSNVGVLPILPVETQRPREVLRLALAGAIGIPWRFLPSSNSSAQGLALEAGKGTGA